MTGPPRSIAPAAWLAGAAVALAVACAPAPSGPERLVLIVIDTLRRDHVSAYGEGDLTPRIDALAARGQAFGNVRSAFHQTTMSMGSLFTGRTPSLETPDPARSLRWNGETWCGMARYAQQPAADRCIPERLPTLGERMRAAGYWTIGIPSNQFLFGEAGFRRGFDDWIEVGLPDRPIELPKAERRRLSELRSWPHVLEAVEQALARRESDRFFLYVHFMDVHDYHYVKIPYADAVRVQDEAVGRLLDTLEREGLLEGATVVLTADHGERLDEVHRPRGRPSHYGNPSFEEVLAIPLIVAPAVVDDPDRPMRTQDVRALVDRIAGLEPPVDAPGESEPRLGAGEHFLSERGYRTWIDGTWKSAVRRRDGRHFLYDLSQDPAETVDVSGEHPDVVRRHEERLRDISAELATTPRGERALSEEERRTLEALGYVE